jgi:hypothetical protein
MRPLNKGSAVYHAVQGLYWRNTDGELLAVDGSRQDSIRGCWNTIWQHISLDGVKHTVHNISSDKSIERYPIPYISSTFSEQTAESYAEQQLQAIELHNTNTNLVLGLITSRSCNITVPEDFRSWAETFLLLETQFKPFSNINSSSSETTLHTCNRVADIFNSKLRNLSRNDQWDARGREFFINRVYGFVEQNQPIIFCLPAFPCKSPNPSKVGGTAPDAAEYLALNVLREFIKAIEEIYEPGATLWIISDGHVFADCSKPYSKLFPTIV